MRQLFESFLPAPLLLALRSAREYWWDAQRFAEVKKEYRSIRATVSSLPARTSSGRKTVLFYPDTPGSGNVTYQLCALMGHRITRVPERRYDVVFKRRDITRFDPSALAPLPSNQPVINANSLDISKRTVGRTFRKVFGYSLAVDPHRDRGQAVQKSDLNAAHDGRIVTLPLAANEISADCVYQRAIDNTVKGDLVVDYRVPVHGKRIPLVYLKYRPINDRFSNRNAFVRITEPGVVFDSRELELIIEFASEMGIDYGEFDILRDNNDQRVYIVDANNTPSGPPNGLSELQKWIALQMMRCTFSALLDRFEI